MKVMRLNQYRPKRVPLLGKWAVGLCFCGAIGCAVGGRSVSIDSNSRIPFFGLELQERQRKSSGPPIRSIHSDKTSNGRIEALGLTKGLSSVARFGQQRDRESSPLAPIPVPRTDSSSSAKVPANAQIDFR